MGGSEELKYCPPAHTANTMKTSFSEVLWAGLFLASLQFVDATIYPDCSNGPLAKTVVCDPTASPPDRAAALVKAMNISEKLVNLVECVLFLTFYHVDTKSPALTQPQPKQRRLSHRTTSVFLVERGSSWRGCFARCIICLHRRRVRLCHLVRQSDPHVGCL